MPATYEPIATTTLGSGSTTIDFSSIPSSYTDLRLVLIPAGFSNASALPLMRLNSDTASNYSMTVVYGTGSVGSLRTTSQTSIQLEHGSQSTTVPTMYIVDLFSYAGSTNKTVLISTASDLNGSGTVSNSVGLYRSTTAISSINLLVNSTFSYNTGTTATLYGIKAA